MDGSPWTGARHRVAHVKRLPIHRRVPVIQSLLSGHSARTSSSSTGVAKNAVRALVEDISSFLSTHHDAIARGLRCPSVRVDGVRRLDHLENDEGRRDRAWTWWATDVLSGFAIAHVIGEPNEATAVALTSAVRRRLGRIPAPAQAVRDNALERDIEVAFWTAASGTPTRQFDDMGHAYDHVGAGEPIDERWALSSHVALMSRPPSSPSHKRDTRERLCAIMLSWHDYARIHPDFGVTPAMALGLSTSPLTLTDLMELGDRARPGPGPRGPYRRKSIVPEPA